MLIEDVTENTPRDSAGRAIKYICTQDGCAKRYAKPCLLKEHMRTHFALKPHVCTLCDKSFTRERNLSAHMVSHKEDRSFICASCGKTFKTRQHLVQHEETHTPLYFCPYEECKKGFRRKAEIRGHLRKDHLDSKPYECSIDGCNDRFKTKRQLTKHENTVHSEFPKYHCGEATCDAQFHTFDELFVHLKSHRRLHSNSLPVKRTASSVFSSDDSVEPIIEYMPESPVSPSSPETSSSHPVSPSGKKNLRPSLIDLISGDRKSYVESRKIPCSAPNCQFRFQRQYDLERHMASVHRTIPESYEQADAPESVAKKPRYIDVPDSLYGFEVVRFADGNLSD